TARVSMKVERGNLRVLVVEDDLDTARLVERRLVRDGYDMEIAEDPTGVIDRLQLGVSDWEVVIMDVNLPKMSGVELLKTFRQRGSMASVVMLTGDDTANTATPCMRAGAFHYLTKPVQPEDLSIVVESAARYSVVRRRMLERPTTPPTATKVIGTSAALRQLI